jgi:hypothetical protein
LGDTKKRNIVYDEGESPMSELPTVFNELKSIMKPYAALLDTKVDNANELSMDTRHLQENKRPLFFGAVQLKKNFVSFHLMPVYVQPALLRDISPALRKRMQGKSCFNFSRIDKSLFDELSLLTEAAYASYKEQGFV